MGFGADVTHVLWCVCNVALRVCSSFDDEFDFHTVGSPGRRTQFAIFNGTEVVLVTSILLNLRASKRAHILLYLTWLF